MSDDEVRTELTAVHGVGLAAREPPFGDGRGDDPPAGGGHGGTVVAVEAAVSGPDGARVGLADLVAVPPDGSEAGRLVDHPVSAPPADRGG